MPATPPVLDFSADRVRGARGRLARTDHYATAVCPTVQGWLQVDALALIWSLLDTQSVHDIRGDVLEIGVFAGKTFGLLASALGPGEEAVAVDPLDERRRAMLEDTLARAGIAQPPARIFQPTFPKRRAD